MYLYIKKLQISIISLLILPVLTLFFFASVLFSGCSTKSVKIDFSQDEIIDYSYSPLINDFETYLTENNFQGAVLFANKKTVIFAKGFGECDSKAAEKTPITINSTFEIGSVTKQITAAAIMQLAENQKLSVNDTLEKYFPDFIYNNQITIEMLLNMRSGLTDCLNATSSFFPEDVANKIEKNTILNKPLEKEIILKYLNTAPLFLPPGSNYFYCNTNYYLLAKIIEQVSGLSYNEYIQNNIFTPLNMSATNTDFQNTDTRGYDWKGRYYSIPDEFSSGYGNVNSSVVDLYKWTKAFTSGKVVKKKTLQQMINTESYGYGINYQNGEMFHAGVTSVFNSMSLYYPKDKIIVIVLINKPVYTQNAATISRELYNIYKNQYLIQ